MNYSTTDTYQMKRDILSFTKIISNRSHRPDKKFSADMVYGTLASGSCHLTDIIDQLHEKTKKVNAVERLTKHLNKGIPNRIKYAVINAADPIKDKVAFHYYRISKGISRLLSYAKEGVRFWFKTKRPKYRQLCLKLIA